jgi:hypothetical protein
MSGRVLALVEHPAARAALEDDEPQLTRAA